MRKHEIKRKKRNVLLISYLSAAVVALGILAGVKHEQAKIYQRYVANDYQHAFDELVTAVSEMDAALQKSMYATSPSMISAVCTELFGKAMTAQMSLSALPFSTQELEQTASFISHVGDYAFVLSRSAARGLSYTEKELRDLRSLSDSAQLLAGNMKNLQLDLLDGVLRLDELIERRATLESADDGSGATVGSSMRLIEKEFPETPSLVYDGPFSEHLSKAQPKFLQGREMVDADSARRIAAQFSGISRGKLYLAAESEGEIPYYCFSADLSGYSVSIAVTKQGGQVLGMMSSRQPVEGSLSEEQLLNIAHRFLDERGFHGLVETYRIRQDNTVTMNFAYRQGDVLCYSDLVKLAIAEDTGTVCGFECQGYLTSHHQRQLPSPAVSEAKAREKVPPMLTVLSSQMALVPSEGQQETLCYEFKCSDEQERHCLIYVDAQSGEQHRILLLIEDETGALTI